MRTPIGTAIFFTTQILQMLTGTSIDPNISKFLNLILSQMTFMQSFVEDLLDLRQIRDGLFSLTCQMFDPNEVLDLIKNIFHPQADAQRLDLSCTVEHSLRPPSTIIQDYTLYNVSKLLR